MASHRIRDVRSVLLLVSMLSCASVFALNTSDYAVLVSASVQASPPQITLSWPAASDGTSYSVSRKLLSDTTWGTAVGIGTNLTYTDTSVSVGNTYEYRVIKTGSSATGYGYIAVGLQAPLIENRGTVVLVVENTYASDLSSELTRLQQDLVGDGWTVVRRDVSRTDTVVSVKNTIKAVYDADPTNVKAVFLFGRVPVPYSGNTAYDGHGDHQGAWPSDTFYGEMNGTWTDTSVNNTTPSRNENDNIPGDGKYDQSSIPSDMELQVGRVDLYNMPAFAPKTEKDLLRQYLNKDHNFRHKIIDAQRRGLIDDNFGTFSGEAFAASGWRNFAPFFGASNVFSLDWFGTLPSNSYMWAYGCGGGWYQGSSGVGNTSQFASNDTQAVFNILFGSYNGDWDANDAFLRAPLATTTYGLTCAWAGRPHWFFHHMGAGLNIGYSARITQNNNYGGLYQANNFGTRGTHVNLMGDPTLRMHIVAPPSGFTATSGTGVSLSWTASTDTVVGYHVYRSANATGPFTRLTTNLVTGTSYTDSSPPAGALTYMVRAVKLESTPSGSYYNPSQGIFAAVTPPPTQPPVAPSGLTATANSAVRINLSWTDNSNNETQFKIERKTGAAGTWGQIGTVGGNITTYVDTTVAYGTQYYYRVRASNSIGNSAPSNEANATTNAGVGPGTGTGLTGDYYDNMDFTALKLTRTDATVNFDFGGGSPDASVGADTFSVRWRGQVQARFTETYTFYVTSDDGVRLWVNNQQLVNNWVDQGPTERSGTLAVVAGQKYDIVMEYYENGGGAVAKLAWSSLSTNKETIPQTQLYPVGAPPTPGVPGSLSANAVSKSQIDLTWTDTANNENGFKIERKTGAAGTFAQIGTAGANATSYSDTTVAPDTTYYYQVRAYNGSGDSAYSNIASATTPALVSDAEFVTQSVPTALTTGDTANVTVEMKNTGETTWAIGTFQLYAQSPAGNSTWGLSSVDVTAATAPGASVTFSFSITAPATAGTYVFEWRMLDKAKGEFGQASTSVSIIVSAPTPPPPPNGSPTLTSGVTASPSTVVVNQPVTFSVGASDPNGDPLTTTWNFG
ncbi:MAG TPA: PA14 domain-containing protein, partial [Planctomycetota bacterium]|nr:PA14 domain-containing protein [Planctomycetota bacterium]